MSRRRGGRAEDRPARGHGEGDAIQPLRTIIAAIAGGWGGAAVVGVVVGYVVSDGGGLVTLGAVIAAAALGALGGVSAAMAVELRDRPVRGRVVAILTVLVVGPMLCALGAWGIAQTALFDDLDTRHLFVVWLGIVLPATALLGRWFASGASSDD